MEKGHIVSSEKDRYRVYIERLGEFLDVSARGVFREKDISPTVGDYVDVEGDVIVGVHERKNLLLRPPVANVDQVLVVQTLRRPDINALVLDKVLISIEKRGLPLILCFNKMDVAEASDLREWVDRYEKADYRVFTLNSLSGENVSLLKEHLIGKITAVAGPSGAGKSTLIRRLSGDQSVRVGKLSKKTDRGRQTTRNSTLFPIGEDSYIFDTPGFSSLDLRDFTYGQQLGECFPEIRKLRKDCRFRNCTHRREPKCAVREGIEEGTMDALRYENYCTLFEAVERNRPY